MTATLDRILAEAVTSGAPDGVVLMRLLGEADSEAEGRAALARAVEGETDDGVLARLVRLERLWEAQPQAWSVIRSVLAVAAHDRAGASPTEALDHWAGVFDRLAAVSPEAGVALYALGSPDLLDAATQEVVDYVDRLGLLGSDRDVLDFGCGIGRIAAALAPRVRSVLGTDLSAGMIAEARRRHGGIDNLRFAQGDAALRPASLDLVLAADVFPYLVQAGGELARSRIASFAGMLRPGGAVLILNYSYRGDAEADRRDVEAAAAEVDFAVLKGGSHDLKLWDAATFLLRKPA